MPRACVHARARALAGGQSPHPRAVSDVRTPLPVDRARAGIGSTTRHPARPAHGVAREQVELRSASPRGESGLRARRRPAARARLHTSRGPRVSFEPSTELRPTARRSSQRVVRVRSAASLRAHAFGVHLVHAWPSIVRCTRTKTPKVPPGAHLS